MGGSGLYSLIEDATVREITTRYGAPSSPVTTGTIGGRRVVFITRHGVDHSIPPHRIDHRANVAALKEAGCDAVITSSAVGSLRDEIRTGDFVLCDQFVDRTTTPPVTFFDGPRVEHVSMVEPYCPVLRREAAKALAGLGERFHPAGTAVVFSGPRFSTRAESHWFQKMGWDVLSMTQHPEVTLIREAEMCCVNLSFVTDADAGTSDGAEPPVTAAAVWRRLEENQPRIKAALAAIVASVPEHRSCACRSALSQT
ncbi:MAG TPA: MTAP family purine nucleoside phosphorylase [Acidimicrobiia bacterium]|nr:MTAP family purine nucleoside phosphorylase [Acidimicrobiia bacterium]